MALTSLGDQGRLLLSQRQIALLRTQVDRSAAEMTTGQRQDLRAPASGDLGQVLALRRDQRLLESYRLSATEAATRAQAMQGALQTMAEAVDSVSPGLALAAAAAQPGQMATAAATARTAFLGAVATLNSSAGGGSLFSGALSDRPALIGGETMLAALGAATATETTVQGLRDVVASWFGPGGSYESLAYLGDVAQPASRIGDGESLALGISALSPEVRSTLQGLALAALSARFADDPSAQATTLATAAGQLLSDRSAAIELQARLGQAEARIEGTIAEVAARQNSLALAEQSLIGVDPYTAATAFEDAASRLDTVFAVTARMSRLSLLEHIR